PVDPRGRIFLAQSFEGRNRFVSLTSSNQPVRLLEFLFANRERTCHYATSFLRREIDGHLVEHRRMRVRENAERFWIALAKQARSHVALPIHRVAALPVTAHIDV